MPVFEAFCGIFYIFSTGSTAGMRGAT